MSIAFSEPLYASIVAGRDVSDDEGVRDGHADHAHDRALVARVREGDAEAFAGLVRHYIERVTRFAIHFAGAHDTAEDLVQSVFVSVWEQRARLDPDRSFRSYLFKAVRNRALDERSAQVVRLRHERETEAQSTAVSEPESAGSDTLAGTDLGPFIRRLSPKRQTAIRLRYEAGLRHAEIAEVMGISTIAATQLVLRGLEDLKRLLGV